jgi:hypothetical protein
MPSTMKRLFLATLFAPLLLFSSCVKEGCTDEEAINYDAEADDDDGSCVYAEKFGNQVVKFSLTWDGDVYEGYEFDSTLAGRSVLLYMEHPDFPSEWTKMPFTNDGISYYYTEKTDKDRIFVYSEDANTGAAALGNTNSVSKDYKAVIMTNSYLKENPEVKEYSYQEMEEQVLQ